MRTVQMTLDDNLVSSVDRAARRLHTTRSGYTRMALRRAISEDKTRELEAKHQKGYARRPVQKGEFDIWESEQAWGDK